MSSRPDQLVATAAVVDVVSAIEAVDLDAPWDEVAPSLRIALPRRRPLPPGSEDLPTRTFPPGISASLGLDIGPAMLFVSDAQLEGWGVAPDEAFDRARANVRERVAMRRQFALLHERVIDVPTTAFQSGEGWAAALLLEPAQLGRVFGSRSGLVLAPMRDLVLMMPLDADPALAYVVLDEFAAADMNALDLPLFSLVDGRLSLLLAEPIDGKEEGAMH